MRTAKTGPSAGDHFPQSRMPTLSFTTFYESNTKPSKLLVCVMIRDLMHLVQVSQVGKAGFSPNFFSLNCDTGVKIKVPSGEVQTGRCRLVNVGTHVRSLYVFNADFIACCEVSEPEKHKICECGELIVCYEDVHSGG